MSKIDIISFSRLYGVKKMLVKRLHELECLLNIRHDDEVATEFEILKVKLHNVENELFQLENRAV